MRSSPFSQSSLLLVGAGVVIGAGFAAIQGLKSPVGNGVAPVAAPVRAEGSAFGTPSTSANGANGLITGGTHTETVAHSSNVLAAGDHHIEAKVSPSGKVEIFIYGQKERQLQPIPTLGLDLLMEVEATVPGEDSVPVPMTAKPYPTDPKGTASRFVGQFDRRDNKQNVGLNVTLPIQNQTYRVQFQAENLAGTPTEVAMPQAVSSSEADKLFLTPGGLYTEADIAANGRKTATQKYGMQMSAHDPKPQPGDRICPITDTKANPRFAWIVGGKTYLFCCPPCIEEFVTRAKTKPSTIKAPEAYTR
jgi:YHS domain-containing protein